MSDCKRLVTGVINRSINLFQKPAPWAMNFSLVQAGIAVRRMTDLMIKSYSKLHAVASGSIFG